MNNQSDRRGHNAVKGKQGFQEVPKSESSNLTLTKGVFIDPETGTILNSVVYVDNFDGLDADDMSDSDIAGYASRHGRVVAPVPEPEPTLTVDDYGTKHWRNADGLLHNPDGPAVEWSNGSKEYYINDQLHRTDGPAVEHPNGDKEYWVNGGLHRTDGPAVERPSGYKSYWVNGRPFDTEEEWRKAVEAL